jgi:hypothetical protein
MLTKMEIQEAYNKAFSEQVHHFNDNIKKALKDQKQAMDDELAKSGDMMAAISAGNDAFATAITFSVFRASCEVTIKLIHEIFDAKE